MVFLRQSKKFMPPPVGKIFLGHLNKYIMQRKKNSCKQLGDGKKFMHRKIAQTPPPLKYLMVRP